MGYRIRVAKPLIGKEDGEAVVNALREGRLSAGVYVEEFERTFASYIGTKGAVAVSSGTAALHLALRALGIGPGDEVITTPFTFAATANVIVLLGAKPVFVDIEPETYNLNNELVSEAITAHTKAIMPIHYGGQCSEMDEFMKMAKEHELYVIEDAAPAAGALYKGRKAGSLGHIAGFSFYPDKNMTTGEGGMITSNDEELLRKARIFANHGAIRRYYHVEIGWNYRMADYVAALGLSQVRKLERIIEAKNRLAKRYDDLLSKLNGVITPLVRRYNRHTYTLYTIRVESEKVRERIRSVLEQEGVETRVCFPPVHKQPSYVPILKGKRMSLPVSENCSKTTLCLPLFADLTEEDQDLIVKIVKRAMH